MNGLSRRPRIDHPPPIGERIVSLPRVRRCAVTNRVVESRFSARVAIWFGFVAFRFLRLATKLSDAALCSVPASTNAPWGIRRGGLRSRNPPIDPSQHLILEARTRIIGEEFYRGTLK